MSLFKRKPKNAERELRKLLGDTEFPHVPQVAMRIQPCRYHFLRIMIAELIEVELTAVI